MQFTTNITEDEYIDANRLKTRSLQRTAASFLAYFLTAAFWILLIGAWITEHIFHANILLGQNAAELQSTLFPGAIAFLLWIIAFRAYPIYSARRKFRNAQNLRGDLFQEITSEGLMQKTAHGSYGFSRWQDFSYWRESKKMFIVVDPTNVFCMIPKANLSREQRNEIRSILTAALPRQ